MTRLKEKAVIHGFSAEYLTVPDVDSEVLFLKRLMEAMCSLNGGAASILELLRPLMAKITQVGPVRIEPRPDPSWTEIGEEVIRAVRKSPSQILLLVDALPLCVASLIHQDPSGTRARHFLHWFRRLREERTARWLLAGSIGLDTVTRQAKMGDTINDLYPITDFGAFDSGTARAFLSELAKTYNLTLSDGVLQRMLDKIGWLIPFHLCHLFEKLRERCGDRRIRQPEVADVDRAFEALVRKTVLFDYWDQRLTKVFGPAGEERALSILTTVARDPNGATKPTLAQVLAANIPDTRERNQELGYLLDVLERDGYLIREGGRYCFRSNILREFWLDRELS